MSELVVIVAEASPGTVTVVGLTVQTGGEVDVCFGVTRQLRPTVPMKPLTAPTEMVEDEVPSGPTAFGESAVAVKEKSGAAWLKADGNKISKAPSANKTETQPHAAILNHPGKFDFNMSRVRFK